MEVVNIEEENLIFRRLQELQWNFEENCDFS